METPTRERGPAEELVARRLKPLNKKIQRFRNYATQDASTLNADQRSAIAALPALEAVSKELDEVMKAMEEVELVAAAKAREEREAAARDADASAADRLKDHGVQVAAHVMGFMGLHSLLHPSRPSDHTNLTFAPLTLPLRLQEEVLATDILRVARMHDELAAGGDSAHAVLQVLAEGSTGADEENDHIHHLLVLLASSDSPPQSDADAEIRSDADTDSNFLEVRSTAAEPALSTRDDASTVAEDDYDHDHDSDLQRTPVMSRGFSDNGSRGAALNFLQEDELALPEPQIAINSEVVVQHYEVIEPASAIMSEAAESLSTPQTPMDWSAEDDTTDTEAVDALADALADAVIVEVSQIEVEAAPIADAPAPKAKDTKEAKENGKGQGQQRKRRPQRKDVKDKDAKGKDVKDKDTKDTSKESNTNGTGEKKERAGAQGKGKPSAAVDEDGFEVKQGRRASTSAGAGRGRGAPRGRGRGGAPRDGRPANGTPNTPKDPNATPRKANGSGTPNSAAGKRVPKDKDANAAPAATPKPKPSIYKTTQPSAPASAPIF